ncbi:hypothetical protein SKAU_G00043800 [Synaphobranchus kaupii]|uniref:LRRCT domain-containing protein n=1 Tax=Synaphobranchus kaupii TaxID=118154 RepID=A0A9Q1J927_SYNKA|nr:hypothetical protein SKAU_G00043800 [Synaphobranchus kaupii]
MLDLRREKRDNLSGCDLLKKRQSDISTTRLLALVPDWTEDWTDQCSWRALPQISTTILGQTKPVPHPSLRSTDPVCQETRAQSGLEDPLCTGRASARTFRPDPAALARLPDAPEPRNGFTQMKCSLKTGPVHKQAAQSAHTSNQFSKVVCTRRGLTKVPPGIPSNTRYLNLMENGIEMIQADTFRHLHHLERLQLGRNSIRQIEVGAFNGLTSLNTLELFDNRLTIALIERNAFDDVTALVELNLAHNNLSSLPHDLFAPLRYLVELHLHHNPWNCDCDVVWLSWWLREYIPTNSTCCGRCHAPPQMRGRYLVEVDQSTFQCSAPFIADAPRDLNISAERVAELKCRTAAMSSVRWLLPNGTVLSHGNAELNTSNLSYFTTVTVEVEQPTSEEAPKPKTATATPSVYQPVFISTPTVLLQNTKTPGHASVPTTKGTEKPPTSLDEVMKTTKIIIGCFVAVTLLAAVMLIAFYKLRKRHQQRSTVAAARTIEIINVEEDVPPPASAMSIPSEGAVVLPAIQHHNSTYKPNYNTYKSSHGAHWTENNIGNSLHRSRPSTITAIPEPYIIKTHKDKVQETQI